jgi:hypothetical protein
MTSPNSPRWSELLIEAVERPGLILEAYSRFYGYSLGNQIAAICQCIGRGIQPGPIATVVRWNDLGRRVKKGERALCLCMPVSVKERTEGAAEADETAATADTTSRLRTVFVWKRRWFVLDQTEGDTLPEAPPIPAWDKARALETLGIREVQFTDTDGNIQGYAKGRTVAVSPLAQLPAKTLFHELAHVQMGHCVPGGDGIVLSKSLVEAEAESVALLCLESLRLPGAEYCRGYIQDWLGRGVVIPEASAQRIFKAADSILRAGQEKLRPAASAQHEAASAAVPA